ncbi:hypothetical protein [Streptomyces griseus]|uniref:hypothetical protein n=1 Tax=Streptomyces griseus TaxID=1911 RepID=UPI0007C6E185|nr:hypothetical protein [Streptomyces griseus]
MTPWRRLCCVAGLVLLLAQGGTTAYGAASSYGGVSTSAIASAAYDTPSASPSTPDRAGSRAGEGRVRPGRSVEEDYEDEEDEEDESAGPDVGEEDLAPSADPHDEAGLLPSEAPGTDSTEEQPVGRVLRILPLGSGLVLIGLGLGLAFLALRLRRV